MSVSHTGKSAQPSSRPWSPPVVTLLPRLTEITLLTAPIIGVSPANSGGGSTVLA
jgi:hypothetical protein